MKTKHIAQLLTVGLVGLFATAPAVWALNADTATGPKLEDRISKRIEMLDKRLDLSDEQSAELEGILKGKMKEIETLSKRSNTLREEVDGLIDGVLTEEQKDKKSQFKGRRGPGQRGEVRQAMHGEGKGRRGEGRPAMRGEGKGRRGEGRQSMRGNGFGPRGEGCPAMQAQEKGQRGEGRRLAMKQGFGPCSENHRNAMRGEGFGRRGEGRSTMRGEGFGRRGEGRPAMRGEGFGRRGEGRPAMRGEGFGRRGEGRSTMRGEGFGRRSEGRPAMRGEGFGRGAGILERLDKLGLTDEQKDDIKDIIQSGTKNKREAIHEILKDDQKEKS